MKVKIDVLHALQGSWAVVVNGVRIAHGMSEHGARAMATQLSVALMIDPRPAIPEVEGELRDRNRALRKWHWLQAMHYRNRAKLERSYTLRSDLTPDLATNRMAENFDRVADFHIHAVQTLNSAPGCEDTTAEQDAEA